MSNSYSLDAITSACFDSIHLADAELTPTKLVLRNRFIHE
jgi:hypothetical protein